ncbi:MAG: ABC transporter ATP-binding protein [Gemmatimonadaceae bacterium]|nr:ABC transporter ATP-binding protein [Gemmatimonadaceae bacterium]
MEIAAGTTTAIVGPNGAGKSTLLHVLLGLVAPSAGTVLFRGRAITAWPRAELARAIGAVPQEEVPPFPLTVRELVAMGRYPHLGTWQRERREDRDAIADAMRRCDVDALAERAVGTLSGGERQRVRLARALAQRPQVLALDEPTAALDVRHEMAMFELLRSATASGLTVVLVTHHLNLAARYADAIVLLDRGRVVARGAPAEVFTAERAESVFQWPVRIVPHPGPGPDAGAPQVVPLAGAAAAHGGTEEPRHIEAAPGARDTGSAAGVAEGVEVTHAHAR